MSKTESSATLQKFSDFLPKFINGQFNHWFFLQFKQLISLPCIYHLHSAIARVSIFTHHFAITSKPIFPDLSQRGSLQCLCLHGKEQDFKEK